MTTTVKPGPVKPLVKPGPKPGPVTAAAPAPAPTTAPTPAPAALKKPAPKPKAPPAPAPAVQLTAQAEGAVDPETGEIEQPETITGVEPHAEVTKVHTKSGEVVSETTEKVPLTDDPAMMKGPHATVGMSMSLTRKIADYESLKCQVSLYLPCAVDADEINATYDNIKEWVDERINAFNTEADEMING